MFSLSLTPFSTITAEMNQTDAKSVTGIYSRTASPGGEAQLKKRLTMGNGMDFRRLSDLFVRSESAFRINQVRREERVDQRRLPQTGLTCATRRQKPSDIYRS